MPKQPFTKHFYRTVDMIKSHIKIALLTASMMSCFFLSTNIPLLSSLTCSYQTYLLCAVNEEIKCSHAISCVSMELGCAMAQEVSCWPLTANSWVCALVNPCGICERSGTGTAFSSSSSDFPSISFHLHSPYSYIIQGMNNMSISGSSSET
jgi:hypothetical protein